MNQDELSTDIPNIDSPTGFLFVANQVGIFRISMENGESEQVVETQNDWVEWKSSFSGTGSFLAFWIQTDTNSELWLTPLSKWDPELLLRFDTKKYDVVSLEWLMNDHYLLLRLGNIEDGKIGQSVSTVDSYLLSPYDKQVKSPTNWTGNCTILARSPQTERLATWCYDEHKNEYIVVETSGELWFTEQQPVEVLKEIQFDGDTPWAWSPDQELVAYTSFDPDKGIEHLYYILSGAIKPTIVADNFSNLYSFLAWSPNNQFLSYTGKCADRQFCKVVMEIANQKVVWNSQMSNIAAQVLAWSLDSLTMLNSMAESLSQPGFTGTSSIIKMFDN